MEATNVIHADRIVCAAAHHDPAGSGAGMSVLFACKVKTSIVTMHLRMRYISSPQG
jgi:NAD/NADP transhydrogenase beta subunit